MLKKYRLNCLMENTHMSNAQHTPRPMMLSNILTLIFTAYGLKDPFLSGKKS
jgi:hypothetical protein